MCNVLFKLLATLLVLKSLSQQTEHAFPILFAPKISLSSERKVTPLQFKHKVARAVEFAAKTDHRYPSLYSRLELGSSWQEVLDKPGQLVSS